MIQHPQYALASESVSKIHRKQIGDLRFPARANRGDEFIRLLRRRLIWVGLICCFCQQRRRSREMLLIVQRSVTKRSCLESYWDLRTISIWKLWKVISNYQSGFKDGCGFEYKLAFPVLLISMLDYLDLSSRCSCSSSSYPTNHHIIPYNQKEKISFLLLK